MASRPSGLRQPSAVKSSNSNISAASGGGGSTASSAAAAPADVTAQTPAKQTGGGSSIPMSRLPSSNSIRRKITTPGIQPPGAPGSRDSGLATDIDSFLIGDTVYVNGDPTKRGKICFIGEVEFAKGDFAGVALDLPIGNHDGMVQGKRYFQCASNHGLFTKLNRLTRDPNLDAAATPRAPQSTASSVVMSPDPKIRSRAGSIAHDRTPSPSPLKISPFVNSSLALGERVIVASATGGTKIGILRYLGPTEFAAGDWAGVELLTPMGKNNGSVGGKRYFTCKEKHGLFVPASKVISSPVNKTPRRHGSRESLVSVSSMASSAASRSIRRPSQMRDSNCLPTCSLQTVLAEKEKHIEHLIKERELDRLDFANLSRQYEDKLLDLKKSQNENAMYQQQLQVGGGADSETVTRLQNQLEEEHRKLEDLQYTLDEEKIMKADIQSQLDALQGKPPAAGDATPLTDIVSEEQTTQIESLKTQLAEATVSGKNLKEAQTKIEELEQKVEELTKSNNFLTNDISSTRDERKNTVLSLKAEIAAFEKTASEQKELIDKLNQQIWDKKKKEEEVKEKIKKLEAEIENTHEQKRAREAEVIDLVNTKTNASEILSTKINALNDELLDVREKLQSAEESKAVMKRINGELKKQLTQHEELEKSLKKELEDASTKSTKDKATLEKLTGEQVSNLETAKQILEEGLKTKDLEISKINTKLSETEGSLKNATEKLKEQLSQIESLQSTGSELSRKLEEQQEQLQKANEDKTTLKVEVEKKQKEVTELMNSKSDTSDLLSGKIKELNEEIQELRGKVESLEEDKSVLKRLNGEFKSRVEKFEKSEQSLRREQEEVSAKSAKEKSDLEKQLDERVSSFETEKQKLSEDLRERDKEITTLKGKIESAEASAISSVESVKQYLTEIESLKAKLLDASNLTEENQQALKKLEEEKTALKAETEKQQQELSQRCVELTKQIEQLTDQLSSSTKESSSLKTEIATLKAELIETKQVCDDKNGKVADLEKEMGTLQSRLKEQGEQKEKELSQKEIEFAEQIQQLSGRLNSTSDESSVLKKEIGTLKDEIVKSKQTEMDQSSKIKTIEEELVAAKKQSEENSGALEGLSVQIDSLKKDKSTLKEKLIAYKTDSSRFQEVEQGLCQELTVLRNKLEQQSKTVIELEKELADKRASIESSKASMLDASSPQAHIDFLNSIIIDLQRKNEELSVKLNVLVNGGVPDTDVKTTSVTSSARAAYQSLRPYCDICEKFDLHDTEDCPAQVSEEKENTHYGSVRGESRPYCETCEIFGHVTGECDDQETY